MNITSRETMIFAKEFNGKMHYRAGLSTKKQDGSYDKAYIDVRLPRDTNIADRSKINITKGFLTFYKNKEGKDIFYIVVQEFTQELKKEEPKEEEFIDPYEAMQRKIEQEQQEKLDMQLPF